MTREELIESLTILKEQAQEYGDNTFVWDININSLNFVIDSTIKALEQEPRKGMRWIGRFETHEWGKEEWCECPWCHMDSAEAYNFCPNCGADFREVEK